jgi:hypothetical protein
MHPLAMLFSLHTSCGAVNENNSVLLTGPQLVVLAAIQSISCCSVSTTLRDVLLAWGNRHNPEAPHASLLNCPPRKRVQPVSQCGVLSILIGLMTGATASIIRLRIHF